MVNKPGALTHGKLCTVEEFDEEVGKYKVSFDSLWVGWYTKEELVFDETD